MSRTYTTDASFCALQESNERRPHYATELLPVSIERRWCTFHEKWEVFGYLRRSSQKAWWTRKARQVIMLFLLGEAIAVASLLLAGGAITALR